MIENGHLDERLRPHDRLGRLVPHRLNFLTFMQTIPGFALQFKTVPERFYEGRKRVAIVACPCDSEVTADVGDMVTCETCGRIYVWLVKRLLVGNSPLREEATTTT